MTVPTATRHDDRYVHEAVYFDTTSELVEVAAPLLRGALEQGHDVVLACTEANNDALADALGDHDRLEVLSRAGIYTKAVTAVAYFRDLVIDHLGAGAPRVCVLGEVDFGDRVRALDEWRRYEALLNHAMQPFPVWSLCGYDTGTLGDRALKTGEMTHPYLRRDGIQARNPEQCDSSDVLRLADADRASGPEGDPALIIPEVRDLAELHTQVGAVLQGIDVGRELLEDLVVALHEIVINGLRHGSPPVSVRLWVTAGRVECAVTDRGPGFEDPFAGYVRGGGDELPEGRFGLWLARQLCDEVVMDRTPEGFTTRLVVDL